MGNKHIVNKKENINNTDKYICKYNIVILGENGVGTKASLIQRIKEGKFIDLSGEHKEKNEKIIYEKVNKTTIFYLIDTERREIASEYYKNADCIIMGYDVTNKQSFEEIKKYWYKEIKEKTKTNLIYLLGNKIDLKKNIQIKEKDVKKFASENGIKYFLISVKNDINIQKFFNNLKINI